MTDREKLIALFTEFGIGMMEQDATRDIMCEEGSNRVDGYLGFYTLFEFDENDKFIQMGAWE